MAKRTPVLPAITIPSQWGLTRLTIHYEGEDLSSDPSPFAANISAELRTDVRPGFTLAQVAAADLVTLRASVPELEVLSSGELTIKRKSFEHLEFTFSDPGARRIRQLLIYVTSGRRTYTVSGTHLAERFENVRSTITSFAASLLLDDN